MTYVHSSALQKASIEDRPYILLGEDAHKLAGAIDGGSLELTLRHEIAHAIDGLSLGRNRWLSDLRNFRNLFEQDMAALDPMHQQYLLGSFPRLNKMLNGDGSPFQVEY